MVFIIDCKGEKVMFNDSMRIFPLVKGRLFHVKAKFVFLWAGRHARISSSPSALSQSRCDVQGIDSEHVFICVAVPFRDQIDINICLKIPIGKFEGSFCFSSPIIYHHHWLLNINFFNMRELRIYPYISLPIFRFYNIHLFKYSCPLY